MVEGAEVIQPGDKIKISSKHYPSSWKNSPFSTIPMIVEWVENKEGIKEIWVRRDDTPTSA